MRPVPEEELRVATWGKIALELYAFGSEGAAKNDALTGFK